MCKSNSSENFARASYTFGFLVYPNDEDARMPISMWKNCSYTIQVIEQLLRFENKPLFGQLTLMQIDLLANIVKQAALYGMTKNTESVRKSCVRLLDAILPYKTVLLDSKNLMDLGILLFACGSLFIHAQLVRSAQAQLNCQWWPKRLECV